MKIKEITFEPENGVAYIKLKDHKVRKSEEYSDCMVLDFNYRNELIGVELIGPCVRDMNKISDIYNIPQLKEKSKVFKELIS